ncbi:MAG: FHA domain-containing protein, partial [Solirubrobacteraceae bacterium]
MLNTAYADGLLSEETFAHRLDRVLADRLIDPRALIGDLSLRTAPSRWHERLRGAAAAALGTVRLTGSEPLEPPAFLLALDWNGGKNELVLGRSRACDVVLSSEAVSRRHAQL